MLVGCGEWRRRRPTPSSGRGGGGAFGPATGTHSRAAFPAALSWGVGDFPLRGDACLHCILSPPPARGPGRASCHLFIEHHGKLPLLLPLWRRTYTHSALSARWQWRSASRRRPRSRSQLAPGAARCGPSFTCCALCACVCARPRACLAAKQGRPTGAGAINDLFVEKP